MTLKSLFGAVILAASALAADDVYKNDFQSAEAGKVPSEMMVLDGGFTIAEESGNKFLELPGAPLDTFGLLFGPTAKENRTVSAKVFGTTKGRRGPSISVGLGGVGGYKLQVSANKKLIELYKGDAVKASAPYEFQSAKWTRLELTLKKAGDNQWTLTGFVSPADAGSSPAPSLTWTDSEQPPSGRASIGGQPYSTTPIRYDDLFTGPAK